MAKYETDLSSSSDVDKLEQYIRDYGQIYEVFRDIPNLFYLC